MTVTEFAAQGHYAILTCEADAAHKNISGVYVCDLLSWAMAKISSGDVWITVHTNLNVVAVALLTDASCVVIPEGILVEQSTLDRADNQGIILLSAKEGAAQIVLQTAKCLKMDGMSG